ncbi:uncharacterized protein EV420DRAFT_518664 [Desarmillaria tabescens]|uniref:Uncharacterized protein n=1 Tax=Armillaria tabescens TaxID=1929756 RepID=A0AA39N467_ARMTA|nr:uncharacterized protein EV420DRAFT_518664 [Desarmillaria tabescens]KAK0457307.1 hypothetical protein EV420DRAFT_518664 [Desarmillaria tabescens]
MLALRPLARHVPLLSRHTGRIAVTARLASSPIRRFSSQQPPLPSFASTVETSNSFTRRLFYRKDGTPRSKKRGVFIAIGAATVVVLLSAFEKLFVVLEFQSVVAWSFVQCFRVDKEKYASQDFSDYKSTVEYFRDLVLVLLVNHHEVDQAVVNLAFEKIALWEGEQREKVHGAFRRAAEDIHNLLAGGEDVFELDLFELGFTAFKILNNALGEALDGADDSQLTIVLKSTPVDKMKDYEVIG